MVAVDNPGVDQVSRPMQIALVAVVLLAGMWFTVLKPKPESSSSSSQPTASQQPSAPGVNGLVRAVDKAKGASAASDATNAKIQAATGGSATAAKPAAATKGAKHAATTKSTTAAKPAAVKRGTKAAATSAAVVDPSKRLLAHLGKGKVLVILFQGHGADDKAARKAVHRAAAQDRKHIVSAYVPIAEVGDYQAITSDVQVLTTPTVLVIGADRKATVLDGFFDEAVIAQAVGDARRDATAAAAAAAKK